MGLQKNIIAWRHLCVYAPIPMLSVVFRNKKQQLTVDFVYGCVAASLRLAKLSTPVLRTS